MESLQITGDRAGFRLRCCQRCRRPPQQKTFDAGAGCLESRRNLGSDCFGAGGPLRYRHDVSARTRRHPGIIQQPSRNHSGTTQELKKSNLVSHQSRRSSEQGQLTDHCADHYAGHTVRHGRLRDRNRILCRGSAQCSARIGEVSEVDQIPDGSFRNDGCEGLDLLGGHPSSVTVHQPCSALRS